MLLKKSTNHAYYEKKHFLIVALLFLFGVVNAQIINAVAGNSNFGYVGDGGQATAAELNLPAGVAADNLGNFYIADQSNSVIRKVNSSGIISTIAGNGTNGFSGDGGQATLAELGYAADVAVDKTGNIYISDANNNRIRKVNTSGIISTVAGNGTAGFSGDGGQATLAELNAPSGIHVDSLGNLYIAEQTNLIIRMVAPSGVISTIAGDRTNNYTGDHGQATAAAIGVPEGVGVDRSGNIYIADNYHNVIREVNPSGIIATIAGNGIQGYSGDGGLATAAEFYGPWDVKTDLVGNIYISDQGNLVIRKINIASGTIITYAGGGISRGDGGPATAAQFVTQYGISVDKSNDLYIADFGDSRIREVTPGVSGLEEVSTNSSEVKLYPNPNNGQFTIRSSVISGQSSVEIYNMLGEQVYEQLTMNNSQSTIDLSGKPVGVYLYRVITESGQQISEGEFIIE